MNDDMKKLRVRARKVNESINHEPAAAAMTSASRGAMAEAMVNAFGKERAERLFSQARAHLGRIEHEKIQEARRADRKRARASRRRNR